MERQLRTPTGETFTLRDGYVYGGQVLHTRMTAEALAALGLTEYTPPPPEPVDPPPPPPKRYSKLAIVRAMSTQAGLLEAFCAWRDASSAISEQWAAAQYIAEDDPVFGPALAQFAAATGLSSEQTAAMLAACEI